MANVQLFIDFTGAPADQAQWAEVGRCWVYCNVCCSEAAIFLEMAGGNVETAVEIYMSSQGGSREIQGVPQVLEATLKLTGDVPMAEAQPELPEARRGCQALRARVACRQVSDTAVPPWWNVIWPAPQEVPEAWRLQRLESDGGTFEILRRKLKMFEG